MGQPARFYDMQGRVGKKVGVCRDILIPCMAAGWEVLPSNKIENTAGRKEGKV